MRIYLAGKVRKNCWRNGVVDRFQEVMDGLNRRICPSGLDWDELDRISRDFTFPVLKRAVFGRHDYVGPYFLGCDHGCWHGPGSHGLGGYGHGYHDLGELRRESVRDACLVALRRADLVFAWVDTPDCFGTIAEVGYARALGAEVVIA